MKRFVLTLLACSVLSFVAFAQSNTIFDEEITLPEDFVPLQVVMPPSPLSLQVLFVGGADQVQHTAVYGNDAGATYAKEWHDFIGFTPDETGESLGWVSVNHEEIYQNDYLGDGGGMSVFRVKRAEDGSLEVVDQTLEDGREGKYFAVDFVNTVGETGMNCAGISSVWNGRIWTAEEWFRSSQSSINNGAVRTSSFPLIVGQSNTNQGVRDTADFTIVSDIEGFDGLTVKKFQNFNWMVEIDPKQAKAVRKQYNWGRQGFEGGTMTEDGTIYLGEDGTPGWFSKFVPTTPGDYTAGTTYVYKHDATGPDGPWVAIDNKDPEKMLNFKTQAVAAGATMYNRIEWVAVDSTTGLVYWTETGRDNPGSRWRDESAAGAVHDPYTLARAANLPDGTVTHPDSSDYWDYYGRIWVYDPVAMTNTVLIEGGPYFASSPSLADYPDKHLTNPDGLNVMYLKDAEGKTVPYLVIMEDLNGNSFGRTPDGVSNRTCELFLLNLTDSDPTIDDLIRITAVPQGAEITGGIQTSDLNTLIVNSQHPRTTLEFPWNHSLTFAINGFNDVTAEDLSTDLEGPIFEDSPAFQVYPNPTTREVIFNKATDAAIYNNNGQRLRVWRNVNRIDVSDFAAGIYFIQNAAKETQKLIIE